MDLQKVFKFWLSGIGIFLPDVLPATWFRLKILLLLPLNSISPADCQSVSDGFQTTNTSLYEYLHFTQKFSACFFMFLGHFSSHNFPLSAATLVPLPPLPPSISQVGEADHKNFDYVSRMIEKSCRIIDHSQLSRLSLIITTLTSK